MISLTIEPTRSTPSVRFDTGACLLDISGESYPENAAAFYDPVLRHIGEWLKTSNNKALSVAFELRYYNSSSSKAIMNLFDLLESAAGEGWNIDVEWRFYEENEIIQECGEEFQEDYERLDIKLVSIPMRE